MTPDKMPSLKDAIGAILDDRSVAIIGDPHEPMTALVDDLAALASSVASESYRTGRKDQREADARDLLSRARAMSEDGEQFAVWMASLWGFE